MGTSRQQAAEAAREIKIRLKDRKLPKIALITGSGLGEIC